MSYHPSLAIQREAAYRPTSYKGETVSRSGALGNQSILSSGRLSLIGCFLPAGATVSTISFWSATTPGSGMSNQHFSLWAPGTRAQLGVTADDGATAWSANSEKTLLLVTPYPVVISGLYYFGIVVVGTVPTLMALTNLSAATLKDPVVAGPSNTGLTNPASLPSFANAPSGAPNLMWAAWA